MKHTPEMIAARNSTGATVIAYAIAGAWVLVFYCAWRFIKGGAA